VTNTDKPLNRCVVAANPGFSVARLIKPDDGGPAHFSYDQIIAWAINYDEESGEDWVAPITHHGTISGAGSLWVMRDAAGRYSVPGGRDFKDEMDALENLTRARGTQSQVLKDLLKMKLKRASSEKREEISRIVRAVSSAVEKYEHNPSLVADALAISLAGTISAFYKLEDREAMEFCAAHFKRNAASRKEHNGQSDDE
jgi:hypothetical protein